MSSPSEPGLAGDALARRVLALRPAIVRSHHNRYRGRLSYDDVDDLYGRAILVLLEKDPPPVFANDAALRSWLDETMRRATLKLAQSARMRLSAAGPAAEALPAQPSSEPTPEQRALISYEHETIEEYIAGLSAADQRIALLHLWPSSRLTAKKIAAELDMPVAEVRTSIHRITTNWRRYTALSVGMVCRKQLTHLERWQQQGGPMPLALIIHARRCSACRQAILGARTRSYDALLPLAGSVGAPAAGGLVARFAGGVGYGVARAGRRLTRLVPAGKQAGGSALLAGKGAAVAAVAATATVSVAAVGVVAVTAGHPHTTHHRPAVTAAASTVAGAESAYTPVTSKRTTSTVGTPSSSVAAGGDVTPTGGQNSADDRRPGTAANPDVIASTSSVASRDTPANAGTSGAGSATRAAGGAAREAPGATSGEPSPTGNTAPAP